MQKHSPVKYRKVTSLFTKFCSDMEMLPSYTPLFMIDSLGRIVNRKRLSLSKESFESIYNLVDAGEIPFIHQKSKICDAYTVKGLVDDGKNFIVVSKDKDGFSRCVVCSFSEDRCIKLHDYIEKLYSYKDYLDSFSSLAFSSSLHIPAKRIFKTRISGALSLVELASGLDKDMEKKISFPVFLALEKLCAFAEKANDAKVVLFGKDNCSESVVNVPEAFFKLMTSAIALVQRHSINAAVSVYVQGVPCEEKVKITLICNSKHTENDIYERALLSAFREYGFECGVVDDGKEYALFFDMPLYTKAEIVLSDIIVISERIDALVADSVLVDMYDTISDRQ